MSEDIKPLNTVEASKYLWDKWRYKISPHTLETYRSRGGGPDYFEIGVNRFYWPADLDAWVLSRMTPKVGSVSEARVARRKLIKDESKPRKANLTESKQRKADLAESKTSKANLTESKFRKADPSNSKRRKPAHKDSKDSKAE
jgi:hypothetical protein